MEMKRIALILFLLFCSVGLKAQQPVGVGKGMIRTQGTYVFGFDGLETKYYINGGAEYMLTDNIGWNGNLSANIGSSKQDAVLFLTDCCKPDDEIEDYYVHSLFFGPYYHFLPNKRIDLYAGIQPGMSLFHAPEYQYQVSSTETRTALTTNAVLPNASAVAGVAYYGSFFHLFGNARFVTGSVHNQTYKANLNELRLAFGLGFNFRPK